MGQRGSKDLSEGSLPALAKVRKCGQSGHAQAHVLEGLFVLGLSLYLEDGTVLVGRFSSIRAGAQIEDSALTSQCQLQSLKSSWALLTYQRGQNNPCPNGVTAWRTAPDAATVL